MQSCTEKTPLSLLGLTYKDLQGKTQQEKLQIIKKSYYTLSRQHHPDRPGGNAEKFQRIANAYTSLIKDYEIKQELYIDEIDALLKTHNLKKTYEFSFSSFDLLQQEGIISNHERLKREFRSLKRQDQADFVIKYAAFLNLSRSLDQEDILTHIEEHRYKDYFINYLQPERLYDVILRECRIFILRMFAKELLDDFQYRNAIAFGNFSEILDIIKLLSPVKLIVTLINLPLLIIMKTIEYFFYKILIIISDIIKQLYLAESYNHYEILMGITKIVLFFYFLSVIINYLVVLPVIFEVLECIACPINKLIRPMMDLLASNSKELIFFSTIAFTLFMGLLVLAIPANPLSVAFLYLILIMNISISLLIKYMYYKHFDSFSPILGKLYIILWILDLLTYLSTPYIYFPLTEEISKLLIDLVLNTIFYYVLGYMSIPSYLKKEIDIFPLPDSELDREIVDAVLSGHKTATWSHRLFNTPKDAECTRASLIEGSSFISYFC